MNLAERAPHPKRLEWTSLALLAILAVLSLLLRSPRLTMGILCGGAISIVNFHWLCHGLSSVFTKYPRRVKMALIARFYLRLAVTAGVLYWLISGKHVGVIGLVIGLSVVVLNIILTTVLVPARGSLIKEVES